MEEQEGERAKIDNDNEEKHGINVSFDCTSNTLSFHPNADGVSSMISSGASATSSFFPSSSGNVFARNFRPFEPVALQESSFSASASTVLPSFGDKSFGSSSICSLSASDSCSAPPAFFPSCNSYSFRNTLLSSLSARSSASCCTPHAPFLVSSENTASKCPSLFSPANSSASQSLSKKNTGSSRKRKERKEKKQDVCFSRFEGAERQACFIANRRKKRKEKAANKRKSKKSNSEKELELIADESARRQCEKTKKTTKTSVIIQEEEQQQDYLDLWDEIAEQLEDDGIRCDICNTFDQSHDDVIIICDGCEVAVHQTCYGVEKIPDDEWFCMYCEDIRKERQKFLLFLNSKFFYFIENHYMLESNKNGEDAVEQLKCFLKEEEQKLKLKISLPRSCCLCPRKFGALIKTYEGMWIHTSCALWIGNCVIENSRVVFDVDKIKSDQYKYKCEICGWKEGVTIKCARKGCDRHFHSTCGILADYGLNLIGQIHLKRSKKENKFKAYCYKHRYIAYEDSVDVILPIEFRKGSIYQCNPIIYLFILIKRNQSIISDIKLCDKEKSPWGLRMIAYMLNNFKENILRVRKLWNDLIKKVNKTADKIKICGKNKKIKKCSRDKEDNKGAKKDEEEKVAEEKSEGIVKELNEKESLEGKEEGMSEARNLLKEEEQNKDGREDLKEIKAKREDEILHTMMDDESFKDEIREKKL